MHKGGNPFISVDALPILVFCVVAVSLGAKRLYDCAKEQNVGLRKHKGGYPLVLPPPEQLEESSN